MGVVKDAPNHLLDILYVFVGQRGRLVWGEGGLGLTAILFWHWGIRAVLQTQRGCVLVLLELFLDVTQHGVVKCTLFIVPFEVYATIQIASPVHSKFIFAYHTFDEVPHKPVYN